MNKAAEHFKHNSILKYAKKVVTQTTNLKGKHDVWSKNKDESNFSVLLNAYPVHPKKGTVLKHKICLMIPSSVCLFSAAQKACEYFENQPDLIDPICMNWSIDSLQKYDGILYKPEFNTNLLRLVSNEQIELLRKFGITVWPNDIENYLYEAKRQTAMYFKSKNIPHPQTEIFYSLDTAITYIKKCSFPILIKTNCGASSTGVYYLNNIRMANEVIRYIFKRGILRKGSLPQDVDFGYVLIQEFLPYIREYRVIKIGESWFGHEKKGKQGSIFFSGSGENSWDIPPEKVFNFCNKIAIENNLQTMAFDVFETTSGNLLINEAQTWFGSYNPSQMYKNNVPGRFRLYKGSWIFEEGIFNYNQSLNLKILEFDKYLSCKA